MTSPNPLPEQLSHLAQRDAAVRARALEEVLNKLRTIRGNAGIIDAERTICDMIACAVHELIPTPPSPAPDEAAIRAELVAALLDVVGLVQLVIPTLDKSQRIGVEFNPRFVGALALLRRIGAWT